VGAIESKYEEMCVFVALGRVEVHNEGIQAEAVRGCFKALPARGMRVSLECSILITHAVGRARNRV
jgi:hypothetical protein